MSTLLQRIVTAVILVAVLLVVFFRLPPFAAIALVAAFLLAAAWEWAGFVGLQRARWRAPYVLVVLAGLWALYAWVPAVLPAAVPLGLGLAWWGLALVLVLAYPVRVAPAVTALCGLFVLLPAWVAMLRLLSGAGGGPGLVLYALAIVWAADVGAYFAGRRFGRLKLAPRVSPGKTWEGVFGGVLAAVAVAAAGAAWIGLPLPVMVPLALVLAPVSVLGDLTVSLFKRNAGLKDSGHLFPGHGGVLDRVDGVSAAVPLFVVLGDWLQVLRP